MNNEEVLKAVQTCNEPNDEYERNVTQKGLLYSMTIAVAVSIAMVIAEMLIFKKVDYGKPALVLLICGISTIYESSKIERRKLITGILELIVAAVFVILYIGALFV